MFIKFIISLLILTLSAFANDDTLEVYFDTPNLHLLENNALLKYKAVKYLSKKRQKIKYNESIIYISKAQKKHTFSVKHYNNVKFVEEKHPLLALIKRKDRELFTTLLKNDGIKYPMKLKYIFEITKNSKDKLVIENNYKKLFDEKSNGDFLFTIKFKYLYFLNLFYAVGLSIIGLGIIMIMFRKRLKKD